MSRAPSLVSTLRSARVEYERGSAKVRARLAVGRAHRMQPDAIELYGVKLEFGSWTPPTVRDAVYDRVYEDPERLVVSKTLRPEDRVLEIGCGMGYLTVMAARIADEVTSFDANPEIVEQARATLGRNGCTARVDNALLERAPDRASAPFYINPDFPSSSLVRSEHRAVDVPVLDFDEQCRKCTYLLVDIEGAEVDLLPGHLPGVRAICVECHPDAVGPRRISEMLAALFEEGFTLDLDLSARRVLYLTR